MSASSLVEKVVIITGASSGLGRATAVHFASLGSKLVLCGRNEVCLQETVSYCKGASDVISVIGNVTIEADVVKIIERTIEHYKRLDVLVNNAGNFKPGSIETAPLEQYDEMMNTNLRSVYHLTMLAVPYLVATKGAIVNVASLYGIRPTYSALTYSMSKAALNQFTQCVALDLAPKQVRVNSVNPGLVPTKQVRRDLSDETLEQISTLYPIGRLGTPEDVAKAIAFLASSDSSFTTGNLFPVDGGFNLACPR